MPAVAAHAAVHPAWINRTVTRSLAANPTLRHVLTIASLQTDQYMDPWRDVALSLDPTTRDRHAYAGANPVGYVDTDGHRWRIDGGRGGKATQARNDRRAAAANAEMRANFDPGGCAAYCYSTSPVTNAQYAAQVSVEVQQAEEAHAANVERYYEILDEVEANMRITGAIEAVAKDMSGAGDAMDCAGGSASGCAWLLPIAKIGKLKSLKRLGSTRRLTKGEQAKARGIADDLFEASCPTGGKRSFSAITRVLMADGTRKPISYIQVGDWVMAADEATGTDPRPRQVTHVWVHQDRLMYLHTSAGRITTTADHPFYQPRTGRYVNAADLAFGDLLRTANGTTIRAWGHTPEHLTGTAYNLTIQGRHTYYVAAGDTDVLVHNCGSTSGRGQAAPLPDRTRPFEPRYPPTKVDPPPTDGKKILDDDIFVDEIEGWWDETGTWRPK